MCGTFVSKVAFHIIGAQLHELILATTLNSFHWGLNLVLSKDGVHMLIDVIIINWTCKSFFPHHALYTKIHYIGGNTSKRKKWLWLAPNKSLTPYHDRSPTSNVFVYTLLVCFQKSTQQANIFLHQYAPTYEMVIGGASTFLHQKQMGLSISQLPCLVNQPLIPISNVLQAINTWVRISHYQSLAYDI